MKSLQQEGNSNAFYVQERKFETEELKILMDVVQVEYFTSEERTSKLIQKIAELWGPHKAKSSK